MAGRAGGGIGRRGKLVLTLEWDQMSSFCFVILYSVVGLWKGGKVEPTLEPEFENNAHPSYVLPAFNQNSARLHTQSHRHNSYLTNHDVTNSMQLSLVPPDQEPV